MQLILLPGQRVVLDVLADKLQRFFAADNVFVKIALPDGCSRRVAKDIDPLGGCRFKGTNDRRYRSGDRSSKFPFGAFRCRVLTDVSDDEDSMQVIGHDDKPIQMHCWKMIGDGLPTTFCDFTHRAQFHNVASNLAKQTLPLVGADCDEVHPG